MGKTILVCENKIVKVFDGPVNPLRINEEARKVCYTYLPKAEEEYLL